MHPQVEKLLETNRGLPLQKSEGWYQLRRGCLTASAVASAIGINPYEKPEDLILVKCGFGEFTGNAATEHGEKYEDEARQLYESKYGETVHELGLLPHPTIKFLSGSPDGVTESGRLIEIKCPLRRAIGDGGVPDHYMPQLQMLMEILDLEVCDFIQYKPESITWPDPYEFTVVTVDREREWFSENFPIMRNFWDRVLWHREHGCDMLRKPKRECKPKKPKAVNNTIVCEVGSDAPTKNDRKPVVKNDNIVCEV